MNSYNAKLLVFSKAPEPGRVKTRLMSQYSAEQAANIHSNLIHHTLSVATETALCPVELWCSPDTSHAFFQQCQTQYGVTLKKQKGADLGERMFNAFQDALTSCDYVILIGTDCPTLTHKDFQAALDALTNQHDIAISPAFDGGYVLIALSRLHPKLFSNIAWGQDQVYSQTLERINALNFRFKKLASHSDIDHPQDLQGAPPSLLNSLNNIG